MPSIVKFIILILTISLHLGCTNLPLSLIVDSPINKNFIFEPQIVKEIKKYLHKHPADIDELIKSVYEKHAFDYLFYICDECIKTFGFSKIKNNSKQQVIRLNFLIPVWGRNGRLLSSQIEKKLRYSHFLGKRISRKREKSESSSSLPKKHWRRRGESWNFTQRRKRRTRRNRVLQSRENPRMQEAPCCQEEANQSSLRWHHEFEP